MICYIYGLKDPRDKKYRYVGQTTNPDVRLSTHIYQSHNSEVRKWIHELSQLDQKPQMDIFDQCDISTSYSVEKIWLMKIRDEGHPLFNLEFGKTANCSVGDFEVIAELIEIANESIWQVQKGLHEKICGSSNSVSKKGDTARKAIERLKSEVDNLFFKRFKVPWSERSPLYGISVKVTPYKNNLSKGATNDD